MSLRLVTPGTHRVKERRQTPAERQDIYDHITERDGSCIAAKIDPAHVCRGRLERHHAGLKMGMARITDVWHVGLLCDGANQGAWARVHDAEVMAHIFKAETAWRLARGLDRP